MGECRILYREVMSYEDAYRYNSENDAAREINGNEYMVKDYRFDDRLEVKDIQTKEDSSIVSSIFNGIVEVINVLVSVLDDLS